jgi:hypothetical protein
MKSFFKDYVLSLFYGIFEYELWSQLLGDKSYVLWIIPIAIALTLLLAYLLDVL